MWRTPARCGARQGQTRPRPLGRVALLVLAGVLILGGATLAVGGDVPVVTGPGVKKTASAKTVPAKTAKSAKSKAAKSKSAKSKSAKPQNAAAQNATAQNATAGATQDPAWWTPEHMPKDGPLSWPGQRTRPLVRFSHARHDLGRRTSCQSCHHRPQTSCSAPDGCHFRITREDTAYSLHAAFHKAGDPRSCLGCHQRFQRNAQAHGPLECAGCHRP